MGAVYYRERAISMIETRNERLASMTRLQADAEAAYYKMYHVDTAAAIRRQFECAEELLVEASQLAEELGMREEGRSIRARYHYFRDTFRAQFLKPI
jgi:hypothetical protein